MSNLTDKDIDRLSREAAALYQPDDSGLSWSKFEQQLYNQVPDKPPGRWSVARLRPYTWGSVILAVSGLTYFLTKTEAYHSNFTHPAKNQTTAILSKKTAERRAPNPVMFSTGNALTQLSDKKSESVQDSLRYFGSESTAGAPRKTESLARGESGRSKSKTLSRKLNAFEHSNGPELIAEKETDKKERQENVQQTTSRLSNKQFVPRISHPRHLQEMEIAAANEKKENP